MTSIFSLIFAFFIGWFIIKLFVGLLRIFLIVLLLLILIGVATGTGDITTMTTTTEQQEGSI